jgi:hypothetical protein
MKTLKILLGIFIGLFLLFFALNYFNNAARIKNKTELATSVLSGIEKDSIIQKQKLNYWNLYESKQKVDTVIIYKEGETKIVYKEIPVVFKDSTKILNDSLKTDDIDLKWQITYSGEIFDFFPKWNLKQKTITIDNIVKEPYPVDVIKEVPINVRALYLGAYINSNNFLPNYSITYLTKKKTLLTASYEPIDKVYSVGIGYRVF